MTDLKKAVMIAVVAIGLIISLFIKDDDLRDAVQDNTLELHLDAADAGSEDASPLPEDATADEG